MKEKRGTINLSKFIGIRPNAKIGHKEHVFAIETEERKYILRASDLRTKNIWLAKLCEICGQGKLLVKITKNIWTITLFVLLSNCLIDPYMQYNITIDTNVVKDTTYIYRFKCLSL